MSRSDPKTSPASSPAPPSSTGPGPAPVEEAFSSLSPITHALSPHYAALRRLKDRRALAASPLYPQIEPELARILGGVELGVHRAPAPRGEGPLRVLSWNIQRGARLPELLAALSSDPTLSRADVLLLSEVDCGMARSGNRHVARELAAALRMHYAFAVSYLVLGDDLLENPEGGENTLALAGQAILSRLPLLRVENVDLPELKDKFSSRREKRLGKKCAILAEVETQSGSLALAGCHLDSNASPRQRAEMAEALLKTARARGPRVLVGGDLNSTTYDASKTGALLRDVAHKFFVTGFNATVDGYMIPELGYERPLFEAIARNGFTIEGFNDRSRGTFVYDMNHPYTQAKLKMKVGRFLTWALRRRLRRWNGLVQARLDWFAGLGVRPISAAVIAPTGADGLPLSDHAAITVDLDL
jgi:endonuclease/exonuclease/phosphatase family metal-dependent hydrolase